MPVVASRRAAVGGVAGLAAGAALGLEMPSARAKGARPEDLNRLAAALAVPADTTSVALWGSSSMEGGLGAEHTPKPVYIHEELAYTFNPRSVYHVAYGAQWSNHSTILRGVDRPVVHVPKGYSGGKVEVTVDAPVPALWTFTCDGELDTGGKGRLTGSREHKWYFESDGPAETGAFRSVWWERTKDSRHVLWTGKNNIDAIDQVDSDIERLVDAARDPQRDVIVLGQWVTKNDLGKPRIVENIHALNAIHAERYGRRFIDVQAILTSEMALSAEPLWELDLVRKPETAREREQGIVPAPLRGTDDVHLSGWGNLLVVRALVERMKELEWV